MAALDAGKQPSEVAVLFSVGVSTVKRYRQQRRETGTLAPRFSPGRTPSIRPDQREALSRTTGRASDSTLGGALCSLGSENRGVGEHLDDEPGDPPAGLDPKKRTLGATERNAVKRRIWQWFVQTQDPRRFVFVDESGANITLVPRYGWAPKGKRCPGVVPRNYQENLTLIASLSPDGLTSAMILDGAVDRVAFVLYVEHILVPTLRPGQIVILDNLAVHKQPAFRQLFHAAGCRVLFLPSYSPDFNPIEMAFSKIKTYLRRQAARTRTALEAEMGQAIDHITPTDAHGYFHHCGYDSSAQPI